MEVTWKVYSAFEQLFFAMLYRFFVVNKYFLKISTLCIYCQSPTALFVVIKHTVKFLHAIISAGHSVTLLHYPDLALVETISQLTKITKNHIKKHGKYKQNLSTLFVHRHTEKNPNIISINETPFHIITHVLQKVCTWKSIDQFGSVFLRGCFRSSNVTSFFALTSTWMKYMCYCAIRQLGNAKNHTYIRKEIFSTPASDKKNIYKWK